MERSVSYDDLQELEKWIQDARHRAHWYNVHRQFKTAGYLEDILELARSLAFDLRGEVARKTRYELPVCPQCGSDRKDVAGDVGLGSFQACLDDWHIVSTRPVVRNNI